MRACTSCSNQVTGRSDRCAECRRRRSKLIRVRSELSRMEFEEQRQREAEARLDVIRSLTRYREELRFEDQPELVAVVNVLGPMTLSEVGEHFGVSRERIRQIEEKALQKLGRCSEGRHLLELLLAHTEAQMDHETMDDFAILYGGI